MATVLTSITPIGNTTIWEQPSSIGGNQSGIPIAKIVFGGTTIIPSKLAADETNFLINMILPVNYAYRLSYQGTSAQAATSAALDDYSDQQIMKIAGQVSGLLAQWKMDNDLAFAPAASGGDIVATYQPSADQANLMIDNSQEGVLLTLQWVDISADTTIAVNFTFRFEFMMYTIDALQSYRANMPNLVMS